MGLSGSKQTTTSGPSKEAMPYLQQASGALQNTYTSNQGNLANISDKLSGLFSSAVSGYNDNPVTGAARDYVTGTLDGSGGNPQLDNIIDTTNSDIADRINALFSRSGQTGSSRQIGELGKQLSANESNLRYTDWNNEQQRKAQAAQLAAQLGGLDNQTLAALSELGGSAATTPYLGAQILSGGLGDLWGNSQTQTTKQSGGLFNSLLNAGATIGAGFAASDRRLKKNVFRIGTFEDGLPVYSFTYINPPSLAVAALMPAQRGGDPTVVGVMADEVAQKRPWALGPVVDGYMTVDYGKL